MAATTPFQISAGATTGNSVIVVSGTIGATVVASISGSVTGYIPALICSNLGGNKLWLRLTSETSPTVSASDHLMLPNTVQLFSNPNPMGPLRIAIMVSVTTSPNTLYVTPGQGSI